jgi:quercetin dioxygenase-like cupin family protein
MINMISPYFSITQDGTQLNVYHPAKGEGLPKHEHVYSHLTMCHAGSIIVRKEGRELVMTKDTQPVNLVANEWHEIEALEDETVFVNVFAEGKY